MGIWRDGGGRGFFITNDGVVANHDGLKCEDDDEMSAWNIFGDEKRGFEKKIGEEWEKVEENEVLEDRP